MSISALFISFGYDIILAGTIIFTFPVAQVFTKHAVRVLRGFSVCGYEVILAGAMFFTFPVAQVFTKHAVRVLRGFSVCGYEVILAGTIIFTFPVAQVFTVLWVKFDPKGKIAQSFDDIREWKSILKEK